ncbi:MAG: class I SAM-dependent methyltransferase [Polyangiaceae bacterium]
MADYERIYRERAADYDAMVRAEDADGNLLPALRRRARIDGAAILEIGVGTGRLTRLLAPLASHYRGFEREAAMLERARPAITALPDARVDVGDARELRAIEPGRFDVAIAGWVFGHFRTWFDDGQGGWRREIEAGLAPLKRALRRGGALIVIETLGTGATEPAPPNASLAEYYAWLESEHGMRRDAIRTDYRFASPEEAAAKMGFFFGEAFADRVRARAWSVVPECTGIWSVEV